MSTIVERLAITDEEMRTLDLRCLISHEVRRERDADLKRAGRQQAGSVPRDAHLAEQRATRQRALDLLAAGFCAARIGDLLGKSKEAARKLIQRARQEGLCPNALASNTNETSLARGVDTSVHVNGGEALPHALQARNRPLSRMWRTMALQKAQGYALKIPLKPQNQNLPHRGVQLDLFGQLSPLSDRHEWQGGIMPTKVRHSMRATLRASGLTHAGLADVLGVSRAQVTNILVGRFGARAEVAERLKAWAQTVVAA